MLAPLSPNGSDFFRGPVGALRSHVTLDAEGKVAAVLGVHLKVVV